MTKEKKKDQLKSITKNLFSTEDDTVLYAVKKLREYGNEKMLPALIDVLGTTKNEEIANEIIQLFYDLKSEIAIGLLINAIKDPKMKPYRSTLISVFWQSALDASEYLSFFVEIAIKSNYLTCLECLTVVENLKGPFSEEEILDCTYAITEALEQTTEKDDLLRGFLDVLRV